MAVSMPVRSLSLVLAVLVVLVAGCGTASEPKAESRTLARVADGDSLVLGGGTRVRLLQVDAAELGQGECYARAATRELQRLVRPGARVELEEDPRLDRIDRHGCLLRYVLVEGENVNVELVRRGAAAPFFLRGDRGRYASDLLYAVAEARRSRAGMWEACIVRWSPVLQVETSPRRAPPLGGGPGPGNQTMVAANQDFKRVQRRADQGQL